MKGLESVYELLQTRLNEAEIAEAVEDASVQVVDSAVTPLEPCQSTAAHQSGSRAGGRPHVRNSCGMRARIPGSVGTFTA